VGRIYEDRHTLPDLRWFWSIMVYVDPKQGNKTSGRAASLDEAKAQFPSNWQSGSQRCLASVAFGILCRGWRDAVPQ
jgi:hypothetical protein